MYIHSFLVPKCGSMPEQVKVVLHSVAVAAKKESREHCTYKCYASKYLSTTLLANTKLKMHKIRIMTE